MTARITFNEPTIDMRVLIARATELEADMLEFCAEQGIDAYNPLDAAHAGWGDQLVCELEDIQYALQETRDLTGPVEWRGDYYPTALERVDEYDYDTFDIDGNPYRAVDA